MENVALFLPLILPHKIPYIYIYIYIYNYKEFCMGGSKAKAVLYFPYSTARCEQCYIITGYGMAKNWKDFRWFSSAGTAMDKIVNITKQ